MNLRIDTPREGQIAKICWLQGMAEAFGMVMQREVAKLAEYDQQEAMKRAVETYKPHETTQAQHA